MLSIMYASEAVAEFSEQDLTTLLTKSRVTNTAEGLSGLLLYKSNRFMQLLEGPEDAVIARYSAIAEDTRHTNVRVLMQATVEERHFPGWSMAFHEATTEDRASEGFSDFFESDVRATDGGRQDALLEWFRKTPLAPADPARDQDAAVQSARERSAALDAAIEAFRRFPFHTVDTQAVADRAGLPVDRVRKHFPNWNGLLVATLDRWEGRRREHTDTSTTAVAFLRSVVEANAVDPGLMRLFLATVNIATAPEHPLAPLLRERWVRFERTVRDMLVDDVQNGREPDTMEPFRGTEQLLALYEGLQLQHLLKGGADPVAAYDRAVTRLRSGWTTEYVAPVWDLDGQSSFG